MKESKFPNVKKLLVILIKPKLQGTNLLPHLKEPNLPEITLLKLPGLILPNLPGFKEPKPPCEKEPKPPEA